MRIAHVVPPWYPVPPRAYGGIENLVADLAAAQRRLGHEVAVVASADSTEPGSLCVLERSRPEQMPCDLVSVLHALVGEEALERWRPDVVHDHTVTAPLTAPSRSAPTVVTVHGHATGDLGAWAVRAGRTCRIVAISHAQAEAAPDVPWCAVVHNGVEVRRYPWSPHRGDDLVFLGRLGPDKGCAEAIAIARASGRRLLIAGRVSEPEELEYVEQRVAPQLGEDAVLLGELGFEEKTLLLSDAAALLFPLQWSEPFGLVVAEAQACGAPVLTLDRGAMRELVHHGVTGVVAQHEAELVDVLRRGLSGFDPAACREHARDHLDIARTADGYERVYRAALGDVRLEGFSTADPRVEQAALFPDGPERLVAESVDEAYPESRRQGVSPPRGREASGTR